MQQPRRSTVAPTILGPSRAAQYWLGVADREQQRIQQQQQAVQNRQAQYNQQFGADINKLVEKGVSPLWSNDFSKRWADIAAQGGGLRARNINPYTANLTPENTQELTTFRQGTNTLLNQNAQAQQVQEWQKSVLNDAVKNPGKYRQSDLQRVMNIDKDFSFDDLANGRVLPNLPQIQPIINFQEEGNKAGFDAVQTTVTPVTRPDGILEMRESTKLNAPLALQYTNSLFREGTPYAKEVESRLREQGLDETFGQLLQTTDRDEIRSYVDSLLRSQDENNPLTDVMTQRNIKLDSPEYDKFLTDAVDEQLKAEKVLEDAKNEFVLGLQSNVKESDKLTYNNIFNTERRAQARFNTQQTRDALAIRRTQMEISEKGSGGTGGNETYDVTMRSDQNILDPTAPTQTYVLAGAKSGSSTAFKFNVSKDAFNVNEGRINDEESTVSGNLIGTGVIAYDKTTGQPLEGHPSQYVNNPNAEFKIKSQINTSDGINLLEEPSVVSQTLSGESKKFAESSLENARKELKKFQDQQKEANSQSGNKKKIEW